MLTLIKRFIDALTGIVFAVNHDTSFRLHVFGSAIVIAIVLWLYYPLLWWETLFLSLAIIFIFVTELQNSALEKALDRLHPENHSSIKQSKDMAAGSVLLTGFYLCIVLLVIFISRSLG